MRRRAFDALMASGGLVVAAVLLGVGFLGVWAHSFVGSQVRTELTQQQINFPAKGSPGLSDPQIGPYLNQYAGRQLVSGTQAKAFADHYIAVHLVKATGGQTYSQLSAKAQANPTDPALAKQVETAFRGETLRGLLLNAYAFGKMGEIALYTALVSFAGAALMLLLAGLGFRHSRRVSPTEDIYPERSAFPAPAVSV